MNSTELKLGCTVKTQGLSSNKMGLLIAIVRALTPYLLAASILIMFESARAWAG